MIGTSPHADIPIPVPSNDLAPSLRHAEAWIDDQGGWWIHGLGTEAGAVVGQKRGKPITAKPGDLVEWKIGQVVRIGNIGLRLANPAAEDPTKTLEIIVMPSRHPESPIQEAVQAVAERSAAPAQAPAAPAPSEEAPQELPLDEPVTLASPWELHREEIMTRGQAITLLGLFRDLPEHLRRKEGEEMDPEEREDFEKTVASLEETIKGKKS